MCTDMLLTSKIDTKGSPLTLLQNIFAFRPVTSNLAPKPHRVCYLNTNR